MPSPEDAEAAMRASENQEAGHKVGNESGEWLEMGLRQG